MVRGLAASFRMRLPAGWKPLGCRSSRFSAIGSVLLLAALVGGLGYGGWTVLQNIQRVQFAPVEDLPRAFAEVAALDAPEAPELAEPALTELAKPVAATALAELYRQQEVEVPILAPRDGPIAALDPDRVGLLAAATRFAPSRPASATLAATAAGSDAALAGPEDRRHGPCGGEASPAGDAPAPPLAGAR